LADKLVKVWKFKLTRSLYEQGYERQDILNLFRFIDWILELPEGLKQSFRNELEEYERERQMPYVTSIEQGIEQGESQATQKIALNLLRKNILLETIAEVTGLTIDRLQQLQSSQNDA
jgi:predicted transposase/invertase (TIGR01784 family)